LLFGIDINQRHQTWSSEKQRDVTKQSKAKGCPHHVCVVIVIMQITRSPVPAKVRSMVKGRFVTMQNEYIDFVLT
jgi:hypothetical protein